MLKSILMVTMLVTNLSVTEDAYEEYLGYKVVEQGIVSDSLATIWNAEEMIEEIVAILPDGGERVDNQGDQPTEHGLYWLAERIQIFLTMTDKEIIEAIFNFDQGQAPDYDVLLQETGLA